MPNIMPVIVLFGQSMGESQTYKTLFPACDVPVYWHDNSPGVITQQATLPTIEYIHTPANIGISKAYNIAADFAVKHGYDWLLLLDQDTTFPVNAWNSYQEAIRCYPDCAMFAPEIILSNGTFFSPVNISKLFFHTSAIRSGMLSLAEFSPVNSGILVRLDVFQAAGGYRETVRLDFADFQFIERLEPVIKNFILLDFVCIQDFSNTKSNSDQLLKRYLLYLESARGCEFGSYRKKIKYNLNILKHTFALMIRTKKILFLFYFWNYYVRGKKIS